MSRITCWGGIDFHNAIVLVAPGPWEIILTQDALEVAREQGSLKVGSLGRSFNLSVSNEDFFTFRPLLLGSFCYYFGGNRS